MARSFYKYSKWQLSLSLLATLVLSCSSKDKGDSDDDASSAAGAGGSSGSSDAVVVTGSLSLGASLTSECTPDKVVAYSVVSGRVERSETSEFSIEEDGGFTASIAKGNPTIDAIKNSQNADGTYDRTKLSEALGEEVDDSVTDAEISSYLEEMESAIEKGGLATVFVSMCSSASEDKVAEAESFKFIGLDVNGAPLNGIPVAKASSSSIDLGDISGSGDQAKSTLQGADGMFDGLSSDNLADMAVTSNALKILKNTHMNYNASGRSVDITPFYLWNSSYPSAGSYTDPASYSYGSTGMYIGIDNAEFKFSDICTAGKTAITLAPPADIVTENYGTINANNPFNNSGLGEISQESTRSNCGGTDTGFYGAGSDDSSSLMINWSIKGTDPLPEGIWAMKADGETIANFELASSSPIDADGNPTVFIPAVKLTTDASDKVTKIEVKLYRYSSGQYVELTDTTAFRQSVSGFNAELVSRSGNSQTDERASILDQVDGNVFYAQASDFENSYTKDANLSVAIYYEMFGGSYRVELRP